MRLTLLYFAWLRTRIGTAAEQVDVPVEVATVGQLVAWLRDRGGVYAQALANPGVIKTAVNQDYAGPEHVLRMGDEVALFPPVTGG